ncbi:hypothetical protein FQN55_005723 [Onygenales sp. PD_40]|nr:hypothetical protein FQN55_005723 [Onygenales sp. PD_40]
MRQFTVGAILALVAWVGSTATQTVQASQTTSSVDDARGQENDWLDELKNELEEKLSPTAEIYFSGSDEFEATSARWSVLEAPKVNVVVVPGIPEDVAQTVKFANKHKVPFLAYGGGHGAITTVGEMEYGIEIYMRQLSSVEIAQDGKTAKIGGGTMSKLVTDTLWDAGKQTVTGACECVSLLGPGLGGGHGWLQGRHGLIADQFVSMDVVLANGELKTIKPDSDLWWAMTGAGHNFGIVTSVTTKIFDIKHRDWAIETLTFSGDKVEAVYQAANEHLLQEGKQPVDIINWSYWMNIPDVDPDKPVILFYIIQEGVSSVDSTITKPFHDIGPLSVEPIGGTYKDLAGWTQVADTSLPCQHVGFSNTRFPIYLESYNVAAQKKAYDLFASEANRASSFSNSIFLFEGYSLQGMKEVDSESTAFAYRDDNLLVAPFVSYAPIDEALDKKAEILGVQLREIDHEGSGRKELHAYVNYAFGDETPREWYGGEAWRQDRLRALKKKYDPKGKFSFYAPIGQT